MKQLSVLDWIALILVIVGGLNWGLVGILQFDLVLYVLGFQPLLPVIVYSLVGIAALYVAFISTSLQRK